MAGDNNHERALKRRKILAGIAGGSSLLLAGCSGGGGGDDDGGDGGDNSGGDNSGGGGGGGGGGGDNSGSDDSDGGGGGVSEVTVWGWDNAADALGTTGDFYEEDNDMTVTVEGFERPTMKEEFLSAVDSGSGLPDTAMMESIDGPSWIETGGLRDLSEWIERDGLESEFVSGKWEALSDGDAIYALPWDIGPVVTFYRRDVFDEYGVDPESIETWSDLVEAGEAMAGEDQNIGNVPVNDLGGFWRMQFRQLGGEPFTGDGAVNVDSAKSLQVAENIKMLTDSDNIGSLASFGSDWTQAQIDGTIGSVTSGSWMQAFLPDDTSGDWAAMKPPALESGGSRATNWGGSNLVIPADVDDASAEAVWEYMKHSLATEEMQAEMLAEFGLFPAYEPAFESDVINEPSEFMGGQRVRELFAEIAPDIEGYRFTSDTPVVGEVMNNQLGMMVDGEKDPETALEDAAAEIASQTGRDRA